MTYTVTEYRLDYAIWAAYRAAQAGSAKAKGPELSEALKNCGVISYINSYSRCQVISENDFNDRHKKWCKLIIEKVETDFQKEISYGIAAKLLNVFFKGYFILAGNENTSLGMVAHPPIDSVLLKAFDKEKSTKLANKYKWQKLNETEYFDLIRFLKIGIDNNEPFWKIEKYWKLK